MKLKNTEQQRTWGFRNEQSRQVRGNEQHADAFILFTKQAVLLPLTGLGVLSLAAFVSAAIVRET